MTEKPISPVTQRAFQLLEEIRRLSGQYQHEVTLMAVTKTVPPEIVNQAIEAGITLLGENRVQEFLGKYQAYASPSTVHFIGTLQTNKVKYIVDKVNMIQSVDSLPLAREINKRCEAIEKKMDILVEVNIAREASKSGIFPEELEPLLRTVSQLPFVRVRGLMTLGPVNVSEGERQNCFRKMHEIFVDIQKQGIHNIDMSILSMGMSSDYRLAIAEGANLVRLGTALFGKR